MATMDQLLWAGGSPQGYALTGGEASKNGRIDPATLQWMTGGMNYGDAGGMNGATMAQLPDGRTAVQTPDGGFRINAGGYLHDTYDAQGNFLGQYNDGSTWTQLRPLAYMGGLALGAGALAGAGGGVATGAAGPGGYAPLSVGAGAAEAAGVGSAGTLAGGATPAGAMAAAGGTAAAGGGAAAGGSALSSLLSGGKTALNAIGGAGTLTDLLGGYLGYDASRDAANMQLQASREGLAEVQRQYDTSRSDMMPWMQAGQRQLGVLEGRLPDLTTAFTGADLANDPGYQFELQQGLGAVNAGARAGGSLDSGATLKALMEYGQGLASTRFNDAFNRDQAQKTNIFNMLSGVSGTGQTTASQVAGLGQNASNSIASLLGQGANAAASGRVGGANSWINALQNVTNRSTQQGMLDRIFGSNVV